MMSTLNRPNKGPMSPNNETFGPTCPACPTNFETLKKKRKTERSEVINEGQEDGPLRLDNVDRPDIGCSESSLTRYHDEMQPKTEPRPSHENRSEPRTT